jgi:hypothetical protein
LLNVGVKNKHFLLKVGVNIKGFSLKVGVKPDKHFVFPLGGGVFPLPGVLLKGVYCLSALSRKAMQWFENKDLAMVVLANVGTMHIGQTLPNAATLAYQEKFLELLSSV